jgi:phage baseplate assembly protein W
MAVDVLTILGARQDRINLFPESIEEEVSQNIHVLLSTIRGTVPLDRRLGLDISFIDEPEPRGMMKLAIYALETIQEYEPRAEVMEIEFEPQAEDAADGKLYPKVTVRIKDEYLS